MDKKHGAHCITVMRQMKLRKSCTAAMLSARTELAVESLKELLNVARSSITIAAGETSRNKLICVRGLGAAQVEAKLRSALG